MRLNFRVLGRAGQPIIILHGVFGLSDNWQTVGKTLSESFKTYLVDLRNHGQSPHDEEMNYQVMAQDIAELMADEALEKADIIGHSMGGKVAMEFACTHPEMVRKLIVVDIAPKYYPPHHQEILESFKTLEITKMKSRKEAENALSQRISDPGVRLFILKNLGRSSKDEFEWKINYQAIEANIDRIGAGLDEEKSFDGNTLFINGSKSDYVKATDHQKILQHFPMAEIRGVAGAGHWVHAEKPQETASLIREFLL